MDKFRAAPSTDNDSIWIIDRLLSKPGRSLRVETQAQRCGIYSPSSFKQLVSFSGVAHCSISAVCQSSPSSYSALSCPYSSSGWSSPALPGRSVLFLFWKSFSFPGINDNVVRGREIRERVDWASASSSRIAQMEATVNEFYGRRLNRSRRDITRKSRSSSIPAMLVSLPRRFFVVPSNVLASISSRIDHRSPSSTFEVVVWSMPSITRSSASSDPVSARSSSDSKLCYVLSPTSISIPPALHLLIRVFTTSRTSRSLPIFISRSSRRIFSIKATRHRSEPGVWKVRWSVKSSRSPINSSPTSTVGVEDVHRWSSVIHNGRKRTSIPSGDPRVFIWSIHRVIFNSHQQRQTVLMKMNRRSSRLDPFDPIRIIKFKFKRFNSCWRGLFECWSTMSINQIYLDILNIARS